MTQPKPSQIQLLRKSFWESRNSGGHGGFCSAKLCQTGSPGCSGAGEPGGCWDTAEDLGTINDPFLDMLAS